MSQTTITAGQSLVDVTLQEMGGMEALFDLADASDLSITDTLTPGQMLEVPASDAAQLDVAAYFATRAQRINTGAEVLATPIPTMRDYQPIDFSASDFL